MVLIVIYQAVTTVTQILVNHSSTHQSITTNSTITLLTYNVKLNQLAATWQENLKLLEELNKAAGYLVIAKIHS